MARPKKSISPLSRLRVRLPGKLKLDLETIVSFQERTMSDILREQINLYIMRSHSKKQKIDDDPVFPNERVKDRQGGSPCSDYIRFQLPAGMKNELKEIVDRRGIITSSLVRLMAEHYVTSHSLESILLEFEKEVAETEGAIV